MRIIIPANAAEIILLSRNIFAKHTADGASSPLSYIDFAEMQTKTDTADTQNQLSATKSRDAETATQERDLALGEGTSSFLEGTVMFYITSIRDFLMGRFRSTEQKLGDWGYTVNIDNGVVSVVISENPTERIILAKEILLKHTTDGASSILNDFNMADMQTKLTTADTKNTLAKRLENEASLATQERNIALGIGKKQNTYIVGTVLYYICSARDTLLGRHRGRERNLSSWGFTVVESNPTPPTELDLAVPPNATINALNPVTATMTFDLQNTGTTSLQVCLAMDATTACGGATNPGIVLAAGESRTVTAAELGNVATNTFLNITNLGVPAGHIKIVVHQ